MTGRARSPFAKVAVLVTGLLLFTVGCASNAPQDTFKPEGPQAFSIFHLAGDHVVAVEAVNAMGDFVAGKKLIMTAQAVDMERLADPAVAVKTLLVATGD